MALGLYDVIDTGLKIGLGALISALVTFKTLAISHKNEMSKDRRKHQLALIEEISVKSDNFFNSYLGFHNKVKGIIRSRGLVDEVPLTSKDLEIIRSSDANLLSSLEGKRVSESRLKLIGAKKVASSLHAMQDIVSRLRNKIIFDKTMPTLEFLDQAKNDLSALKKTFDSELSSFYEKL